MEFMKRKNTPTRDPKECRWQEINVLETSNRRYRTGTNEVRHYHNCSSRTFQVDLHSTQRSSQDLHTRTSYRHPRRTFIQAPTQRIIKILMQGPLEKDFNRIQDLHKIFSRTCTRSCTDTKRIQAGHFQEFLTRTCTRSCKGLWQHFTSFAQGFVKRALEQENLTRSS